MQSSPQSRARRFISPTKRRSVPARCTASAIAASLPDTISSPFSSVSSRTRFPRGSRPDARARVVERRLRDPHRLVRMAPLDHEQRGHDLRQARDRQHAAWAAARHSTSPVSTSNTSPARGGRRRWRWNASTPASGDGGRGLALDQRRGLAGRRRARPAWAARPPPAARAAPRGPRRRPNEQIGGRRDRHRRREDREDARSADRRASGGGRRAGPARGPAGPASPAPSHRAAVASTGRPARRCRAAPARSPRRTTRTSIPSFDRDRDRQEGEQADDRQGAAEDQRAGHQYTGIRYARS